MSRLIQVDSFIDARKILHWRYEYYSIPNRFLVLPLHGRFENYDYAGEIVARGLHKDDIEVGFWFEDILENKWKGILPF